MRPKESDPVNGDHVSRMSDEISLGMLSECEGGSRDRSSPFSGCAQLQIASCAASVSSSVDKAQQFGPQRVHAASDLENARKMVMAC